ncbi:MAG TPA: hypothetical protein VGN17_03720 [Bryobacteraceae bacterium]|jgi:hypothetical protein
MKSFRRFALLIAAGAIGITVARGLQTARAAERAAPVRLTDQQDRQRLMDLLHITTLRPGRDGSNKQSPNYVNYDESKANPYPDLPDPLKLKNGKKVTKASDWWSKRRPEIVEDFDREVYGRVPKNVPKVKWVVEKTENGKNGDINIVTKTLTGIVDNAIDPDIEVKIGLILVTPASATGPVPVVMQFSGTGFGFPTSPPAPGAAPAPAGPPYGPNGFAAPRGGVGGPGANTAGRGTQAAAGTAGARGPAGAPPAGGAQAAPGAGRGPQGPSYQQQILARGWGYALLNTGSIQADNGAGLTLGIIGLCNKGQPRGVEDWGVLRAWAWGASRALDYFETDKTVDAKRVALEGHSRWGKATLVAMAYDQRFWTAYVSSSGEAGAKLHRRDWGETVQNMANVGAYHWLAGNFLKYSGPLQWSDLPVDSHELIAMCAPRPVFISAGKGGYDAEPGGDSWVDAKGQFMAAAAAGSVYKLLGKKPMEVMQFPPIETLVGADADVAFRQHASGHTDVPNWPYFLDFAAKHRK